jgi:hypothetical protein
MRARDATGRLPDPAARRRALGDIARSVRQRWTCHASRQIEFAATQTVIFCTEISLNLKAFSDDSRSDPFRYTVTARALKNRPRFPPVGVLPAGQTRYRSEHTHTIQPGCLAAAQPLRPPALTRKCVRRVPSLTLAVASDHHQAGRGVKVRFVRKMAVRSERIHKINDLYLRGPREMLRAAKSCCRRFGSLQLRVAEPEHVTTSRGAAISMV